NISAMAAAISAGPRSRLTAAAGANLRELMPRLGHSSTRAALTYLHSTDERQREIADALGDRAADELKPKTSRSLPKWLLICWHLGVELTRLELVTPACKIAVIGGGVWPELAGRLPVSDRGVLFLPGLMARQWHDDLYSRRHCSPVPWHVG